MTKVYETRHKNPRVQSKIQELVEGTFFRWANSIYQRVTSLHLATGDPIFAVKVCGADGCVYKTYGADLVDAIIDDMEIRVNLAH